MITGLAACVAALALAQTPAAEPPAVPWAITGTSSTASIPVLPLAGRVENRFFRKEDRWVPRAGASYLSRGDLRVNPGLALELTWYPQESIGIDLVSATLFASSLSSTAEALRRSTGLLPDSQKPLARIGTGARWAFAYGKLLVEDAEVVVHADASTFAHLGVLVTDEAVNAAGDVGLAFQVGIGARFLLWLDASWLLSYERRSTSSFASGPAASLGVGFVL